MPYENAPSIEELICEIRELAQLVDELTASMSEIRSDLSQLHEYLRVRRQPHFQSDRGRTTKPN